jgi:hypothetical protein
MFTTHIKLTAKVREGAKFTRSFFLKPLRENFAPSRPFAVNHYSNNILIINNLRLLQVFLMKTLLV